MHRDINNKNVNHIFKKKKNASVHILIQIEYWKHTQIWPQKSAVQIPIPKDTSRVSAVL